MTKEVELKLFFKAQDYDLLVKILDSLDGLVPKQTKLLKNAYFDTKALQLRHWDMGLRIRSFENNTKEQTIKTAGQVAGGIHSRPEYNARCIGDVPDLSLFPVEIWPKNTQFAKLQEELYCLFETNFKRNIWIAKQGVSQIEVALDQGDIIAGSNHESLCELELELQNGEEASLLSLAADIALKIAVRLGKASKAQRGYRLGGNSALASVADLKPLPVLASSCEKEERTAAIGLALENWQVLDGLLSAAADIATEAELWSRFKSNLSYIDSSLEPLGWQALNTMPCWTLLILELNRQGRLIQQWHSLAYGQAQLALVNLLRD
ncbi:CYTH domain-containing protein [Shewanella sp.]|uniref:CYTH domain-containing protein n=1 Tax=Shewanella sp. TaxID=50422 RepID=UPI004054168A